MLKIWEAAKRYTTTTVCIATSTVLEGIRRFPEATKATRVASSVLTTLTGGFLVVKSGLLSRAKHQNSWKQAILGILIVAHGTLSIYNELSQENPASLGERVVFSEENPRAYAKTLTCLKRLERIEKDLKACSETAHMAEFIKEGRVVLVCSPSLDVSFMVTENQIHLRNEPSPIVPLVVAGIHTLEEGENIIRIQSTMCNMTSPEYALETVIVSYNQARRTEEVCNRCIREEAWPKSWFYPDRQPQNIDAFLKRPNVQRTLKEAKEIHRKACPQKI